MTKMPTFLLLLLILVVCFGTAVPVAVLVDLLPAWVGGIVLVSFFVLVFLLSLLAARRLNGGRRAEYAARLRQRQQTICSACVAATVGMLLSNADRRVVEIVGVVITFASMCVVWWVLLRTLPARTNRTTADGGLYQI